MNLVQFHVLLASSIGSGDVFRCHRPVRLLPGVADQSLFLQSLTDVLFAQHTFVGQMMLDGGERKGRGLQKEWLRVFFLKRCGWDRPVSKDEGLNILEGYVKVFMLFPHREDIVSGVWPVNNDIPLVQVKAGLTIEKALLSSVRPANSN